VGRGLTGALETKGAAVIALCGYEQVAVLGGRWPTITRLCRDHPLVFAAALAGFTWHIWFERGAPYGRRP